MNLPQLYGISAKKNNSGNISSILYIANSEVAWHFGIRHPIAVTNRAVNCLKTFWSPSYDSDNTVDSLLPVAFVSQGASICQEVKEACSINTLGNDISDHLSLTCKEYNELYSTKDYSCTLWTEAILQLEEAYLPLLTAI